MSKKTRKVADRIITGYLTVKVPIGYAFIRNAKGIIQMKTGEMPTDEQLESIASRFLDLALYCLTQTSDGAGVDERTTFNMPTSDDFFQVVNEVMNEGDEDEEEDSEDEEDEDEGGPEDPEGRF